MKNILYLSQPGLDRSLNAVLIKGLKQNGISVDGFRVSKGLRGILAAIKLYHRNSRKTDFVIVGYDSPSLVIFLRIFCRKKIVYNAVLSVYERLIVSREFGSRFSLRAVYYWLLDFLAVHFADLTIVETEIQADHFSNIFLVSRKKVERSYIGVDEDNFYYDSTIKKFPTFTVLFRGALLPETGAEYAVQAAKILEKEDIKFVMHVGGMLLSKIKEIIGEVEPKNLELTSDFISSEELRILMQKCHLSLGQLSDHPRLDRTIPHKAYESLVMKLPYLTASNRGILELLKADETCIACEPANAQSLAEKILWAKDNYSLAGKIAENGYKFYMNELRPAVLAKNLITRIEKI